MSDFSMLELFRVEAKNQVEAINKGLLELESGPGAAPATLEALMRAAHSLKGAARIVNLPAAVPLAHAMEDCFAAAQKGLKLETRHFDLLLKGADGLGRIAQVGEAELADWSASHRQEFEEIAAAIRRAMTEPAPGSDSPEPSPPEPAPTPAPAAGADAAEKTLRIDAERLDRLMGLAAEAQVEARWLAPFAQSLAQLKRRQGQLARLLDRLQWNLQAKDADEHGLGLIREAQQRLAADRDGLIRQLERLDDFERRSAHLSLQLYQEAAANRMRPFADCAAGFPRMMRDLARDLGKDIRFEIAGAGALVDRDILEKLQAPLAHLLRNAADHGIEPPAERRAAGKPAQGFVKLEARHHAGLLLVTVEDDGRGIDAAALRAEAVKRRLVSSEMAASLSEAELFDFLFLPNFTLKSEVTEISGRGVGLDIVLNALQRIRGAVKTFSEPRRSTRFQLQLPLTLSVIRALIVEISGEPYAFPLARIARVLELRPGDIHSLEGREYFSLHGESVALVAAAQVLELPSKAMDNDRYRVVVIGERGGRFGLAVDRLVMERSLAVRPLDPRLGKVRDIMAAALLDDGLPALILDVEDLIRSIDRLVAGGRLNRLERSSAMVASRPRKHILVVDDSFTVREVERKLLESRGYRVDVAVDGMDGWNAVRAGDYDLVVSDIDMPRMNGIELVSLIRKDAARKRLPIMIVSYKEREEDRQRGLEVGADYYLTKSSFQDETLLEAVQALIGEA
jgi:two-component system sensor histidine kinase and response regulator WspE